MRNINLLFQIYEIWLRALELIEVIIIFVNQSCFFQRGFIRRLKVSVVLKLFFVIINNLLENIHKMEFYLKFGCI